MKELPTWAGRSSFHYSGSIKEGTTIVYGSGYKQFISSEEYRDLINHFRGREVNIGTSRTEPPRGSVGAWLQENVTPVAMASYVGAILIEEGHADKTKRAHIKFK